MYKFKTLKNNTISHHDVKELAKKVNSFTGIRYFDLVGDCLSDGNENHIPYKSGVAYIHTNNTVLKDEDGYEWIVIQHLQEMGDPVYAYIQRGEASYHSSIISFSTLPAGYKKAEDDKRQEGLASYYPEKLLTEFEGKYYLPANLVTVVDLDGDKFKTLKTIPEVEAKKLYKKIGSFVTHWTTEDSIYYDLRIFADGTTLPRDKYKNNFIEKKEVTASLKIVYATKEVAKYTAKILYEEVKNNSKRINELFYKKNKKYKTKKYIYTKELSLGDKIHQNNFKNVSMHCSGGWCNPTHKFYSKKGVAFFDWKYEDTEYPEFNFDFSFSKKLENGVNLVMDKEILNFFGKMTEELPTIEIPQLVIPDETILDWSCHFVEDCWEEDSWGDDDYNGPECNIKIGDFEVCLSIEPNNDDDYYYNQTGSLQVEITYKNYYNNYKNIVNHNIKKFTIKVGGDLPRTFGALSSYDEDLKNAKLQTLLSLQKEGVKNEEGIYIKKIKLEDFTIKEIKSEIKEDKIFFYETKKLIFNRFDLKELDVEHLYYSSGGEEKEEKEIYTKLLGSCHILKKSGSSYVDEEDVKKRGRFGRLADTPKDAIVIYEHASDYYLHIPLSDIPDELITVSNKKNVFINSRQSLMWYTPCD